MESFSALLQKNVLNRQRWETREDLRLEIVYWIEVTHHLVSCSIEVRFKVDAVALVGLMRFIVRRIRS